MDPHQNQRVALVSECTRALLGVEFESKVVIRRYKGEIADADKVTVREVFNEVADHTPFMRAGDRDGWRYFLENFLMEAKYVFEGMAFGGVEYKGQKRSFKIEKIADANETPTPIVKRGDPSAAPAVPVYYMTNASTIKLFTDTIPEPVKKAVVVKLPTMPAAPATPTRTSTPTRPQVSTSDEPKPKISIPAGSVKKAKSKAPPPRTAASNVTFDSIGGLSTQIDSLKTLLTSVLEDAEEFSRKGLVPPRGILLYGPPGTGKTLMLKAAASEIKAKSYILDGSVMGKYMGESEASIRKIFAEARKNQPSIIFMDEVDSLAPKRGQGEGSDSEGRIVSTLLTEMDGIEDGTSMRVAVVAATNRPNAIDPALRRAGRFEKELEIGIPDVEARRQILTLLMRKLDFESDSGKSKEEFITALAARTHGYVGADLEAVIRGGFSLALKRRRETAAREIQLTAGTAPAAGEDASMLRSAPAVLEDVPSMVRDAPATIGDSPAVAEDSPTTAPDTPDAEFILTASIATLAITPTPVKDIALNESDVERALKEVKPTAMREIFIEPPTVRWSDIGGQEEVKQALREAVEWPLTHPEVFARLGGTPRKGLLLYGPPGCSKTLTAKALATEAGLNFMAVKGPELFSMYVGESERAVREIFRKARAASPSIIFFDEIDALSASREGGKGGGANVLTALLNEMDGIETLKNVIVLAATNRPEIIVRPIPLAPPTPLTLPGPSPNASRTSGHDPVRRPARP